MGGQETLRLPWRLEPAHKLLSLPRRSVRALDPVIDPFVGAVVGVRGQLTDRFDIAAQLVRDDNAGLAKTDDQLFQKPLGRFGASPWLHQNVEHIPIPIHGPPQPHLHAIDRHDDFIEVPLICRSGPVALDTICEMPTKPVHPFANRFPADDYASLGEQIFYIRRAQREPMVGPNRVGDDLARETKAFQARHLCWDLHGHQLDRLSRGSKLAFPRHLFSYNLQRLAGVSSRIASLTLETEFGVTVQEWRTLAVLDFLDAAPVHLLAQRAGVQKSQMSRLVTDLENRELVVREKHPTDKRSVLLRLTPKATQLVRDILASSRERNDQMLSHLDHDERVQLMKLLGKATRGTAELLDKMKSPEHSDLPLAPAPASLFED